MIIIKYVNNAVSEEFYTGGGDSQSPRPVPFSRLLRQVENTLALFFCYAQTGGNGQGIQNIDINNRTRTNAL